MFRIPWQAASLVSRRLTSSKTSGEAMLKAKLIQIEKPAQKNMPEWHKRDHSLWKRYGQWNPTRKLSRQQMVNIRELKKSAPHLKTVQIADHFGVNPESIRRILKSKWVPSDAEYGSLLERTEKRKQRSIERKRAAAGLPAVLSVGHAVDERILRQKQKRGNIGDKRGLCGAPRTRKPYTESVGDLID